jgi:hypothetical protein
VGRLTVGALPVRPPTARVVLRQTGAVLASAKVTVSLLVILLITTVWLNHVSDPDDILRHASTNIVNLRHVPLRSLIASALVVSGGGWLVAAVELALSFGRIERSRGAFTAIAVFASGHVIATVLTEGAVWYGIRAGTLPHAESIQIDVGISYGMWACMSAAIVLLPRRLRIPGLVLAGAAVLVPLALDVDMTSCGHVISVLIGLAWWPLLARPRTERDRSDRHPGATAWYVAPDPSDTMPHGLLGAVRLYGQHLSFPGRRALVPQPAG